MTTVVATLYDLAMTAFVMMLVWPFFFLAGRGYFHPSKRRLPWMAALYSILVVASWVMYFNYQREPAKLLVSLTTVALVGLFTDWFAFRRKRNS